MRNKDRLSYNKEGFTLHQPVLDKNKFVAWHSIDTIVFDPFVYPRQGISYFQRYIVFLNQPPKTYLDEDASWLNRFIFKLGSLGKRKNLYLTDENPDFDTFRPAAAQALGFPLTPQEGLLHNFDVQTSESKSDFPATWITETYATPKNQTPDAGFIVVYDRFNRGFREIYAQRGEI